MRIVFHGDGESNASWGGPDVVKAAGRIVLDGIFIRIG
jgi:hypothetical protein